MDLEKIWSGWELDKQGNKPQGGEKSRAYVRRLGRRKDQISVLNIIYQGQP